MRHLAVWLGVLVMIGGTLACNLQPGIPVTPTLIASQIPPSLTVTIAQTFTPSITDTPSATVTASPTVSRTPTRRVTATHTATVTPSITASATNTTTPTASDTATPLPTITGSASPTATDSPTASLTVTPTSTFTPSATLTDTPAPPTAIPIPTLTFTPLPSATALPSDTPVPTSTDTSIPTLVPSLTNTASSVPSLTPSITPTLTLTALIALNPTPTATFSLIPATAAPPTPTFSLIPAIPTVPSLTPPPARTRIPQPTRRSITIPTSLPTSATTPTLTRLPANGTRNNGTGGSGAGNSNGTGGGANGSTTGSGGGTPMIGPYGTVTALALTPTPTAAISYSIYGNGTPPAIYALNGALLGFGPTNQILYAFNPQTGSVAAVNSDGVLSINGGAFVLSPYSQYGPPQHLKIVKIVWSEDGRFLLYQTATDDATNGKLSFQQTINDGLWVYDLASRTTHQVFRNQYICCANLPIQIVADAQWAADSKHILIWFTSDPNRLTPTLIDSTQTINLNPAPGG